MENEELNRRKEQKFQVLRFIKTYQVMKEIRNKYKEHWEIVNQIKRRNRAAWMITRAVRVFLRRMGGRFRVERFTRKAKL